MEIGSEPSNTSGHPAGIQTVPEEGTPEVGQRRSERPHISAHGQGTDEAMAPQDGENGTSVVRVRGGTECSTPANLGMRERTEEKLGGRMGRQGVLRGSDEIFEEPGQSGRGSGGGAMRSASGAASELERMAVMYLEVSWRRRWVGVAQRLNNLAGSPPGDAPPRHVP